MANTYTWTITALDAYPTFEDAGNSYADCVFVAHWTCTGTNGATPAVTASVYTTTAIPFEDTPQTYIPYANLTQDEVIGWVQTALGAEGVQAVYTSIDTQIENQINPPVVSPPLPWATT